MAKRSDWPCVCVWNNESSRMPPSVFGSVLSPLFEEVVLLSFVGGGFRCFLNNHGLCHSIVLRHSRSKSLTASVGHRTFAFPLLRGGSPASRFRYYNESRHFS